ncbi:MAG: hypothetical protein GF350_17235 [Chitinivibrionales bacterium]|nr:hypothetical protein [Chitinivibrionales bacterium]
MGEGYNYSTIQSAVDAVPRNLAGRGEQRIVIHRKAGDPPWIYNEQVHIEGGDEGVMNASAQDFMLLTVAEEDRHKGIAGTGVALSKTTGCLLNVSLPYTRIQWLDIKGGNGDAMVECKANGIRVENCIVHDNENVEDGGSGIEITVADVIIRNCVIYNIRGHGIIAVQSQASAIAQNVTVFNAGDCGIDVRDGATLSIQNCISMGSAVKDYRKWFADWTNCSNNMSSDSTAPGTAYIRSASAGNQFLSLTPGNEDFHLAENSAAINAGALLGGFNTDIDGVLRPETENWDMGADEKKGEDINQVVDRAASAAGDTVIALKPGLYNDGKIEIKGIIEIVK